ncbi:MAG: MoaD/ThiS family protein [Ktedonobacterales bacterium]
MHVYVRLFGPLRVVVGSGEIELALSGESATVAQVLEAVSVRYPQAHRYLRAPPGGLPPGVRALVADVRLDDTTALMAPLREDDRLTLLMPIVAG